MYESGRSMPRLRGAADNESEIIFQILLNARHEMLSNAKELLSAEWADKIDIQLEGVPVVQTAKFVRNVTRNPGSGGGFSEYAT